MEMPVEWSNIVEVLMLRLALSAIAGFALACSAVVSRPEPQRQAASGWDEEACAIGDVPPADRFAFVAPHASTRDQQVLDAYSRRGYRLLLADAGYLLFEKLPADMQAPEYLTFDGRKTFLRQLNDAGARGFRLSQTTDSFLERPRPELSEGESHAPVEHRYEYKVLSRRGASLEEFERRMAEVTSKGYRPMAVHTDYGSDEDDNEEYLVVLESITHNSSSQRAAAITSDTFGVVGFKDLRKSTALFRSYVSRGYRITHRDDATVVLQYAPQHGPFEHLLLEPTSHVPESVARRAQRDMNQAASRGFRLAPDGLFLTFGWFMRLGLVMEKSAEAAPAVEYMVIGALRVSTLTRELDSAFAQGFTPVAMKMSSPILGPRFVVLQKPR